MTTRTYIAAMLSLVLLLTGQSMALARTAAGPAGSIVLCTGTGPITVVVDDTGTPMGPVHICPDCTTALCAATLPGLHDLPRHMPQSRTSRVAAPQVPGETPGLFLPRARAPPVSL
jgi:hypothetical protein